MKRVLISIFLMLAFPAFSQQSWDSIKENSEYISVAAEGTTVKLADESAATVLLDSISSYVFAKFDYRKDGFKEDVDSVKAITALFKTYSPEILYVSDKIVVKDEPDAIVGRYIKKTDVSKIFQLRQNRINNILDIAVEAERNGNLDVALKNYCWTRVLTRSIPNPEDFCYTTVDSIRHHVMEWLPEHVASIISNLDISVKSRRSNTVDLEILYKEQPVSSIGIRYFDGNDWSSVITAKDGIATIAMAPEFHPESYKIAVEYLYEDLSQLDDAVNNIIPIIKVPAIINKSAYFTIAKDKKAAKTKFADKTPEPFQKQIEDPTIYKSSVEKVLSAVKSRNLEDASLSSLFTENGYRSYKELVCDGNASLSKEPDLRFYSFSDKVMVRGINMHFAFERYFSVDDVVFILSKDGKIDEVLLGLDHNSTKPAWKQDEAIALSYMMEKYRTAFLLKDIEYIKQIMLDDSSIKMSGDLLSTQKYEWKSFISQLKRSFQNNDDTDIRFTKCDIYKLGGSMSNYGIELVQEMVSKGCHRTDYVLLFVDLSDIEQPKVVLRTLQHGYMHPEGIYHVDSFL